MEEMWKFLVNLQSSYIRLNNRAKELTKSLKETADYYKSTSLPNTLILSDFEQIENKTYFKYCGIHILVETFFDENRGVILWSIVSRTKLSEIKEEYLKSYFNNSGNIIDIPNSESLGHTSDYGYCFTQHLHYVVKKYFENKKESILC